MDGERAAPRPRLSRAESQARTRAELLDAAAAVFAERGFAAGTLDEIAERAGFTTGALYSNFASKEQLFLELLSARRSLGLERRMEAMDGMLAAGLEAGNDPFALATQLFLAIADEERELAPLQAELWLYAVRHPEAMQVISDKLAEQVGALERIVLALLERSGVPATIDAREATVAVVGLFHGLVRQRRISRAQVPDELFANALRWLLAGMAAPGEPGGGLARRADQGA